MPEVTATEKPCPPADITDIVPPARTTPALLMSLVLHVFLLTSMGILWTRSPQGTGAQEDRPVGIALVHRMPDRDRYVDAARIAEVTNDQATASESSAAPSPAAPPADFSPPLDLTGVLESMQSVPAPVSGSGLAGETKLDGDAFASNSGSSSSGDANETTTMLFGISGSGSRFVYVFDRSDSMNGFGGKPLRAAKAELIRSLQTMTERQQFQIIFYNDQPSPFRLAGIPGQMVPGEKSYLALAENHIRSIAAFGGTEHEGALKMALRMSPDVIFFLTDARIPRLSAVELREIRNRADSIGTSIHAIEFGPDPVPPRDSFLRELAAQNHGEYRYIDVRNLDRHIRPEAAATPQPAASTSP
jgi:hypothetical protein